MESSDWPSGPASGRDVSLELLRIIGRMPRDTGKWSRYEPADRSF